MVDGHKIREMREAEDLTTTEFAEKICISQTAVSHIELGVKQPSVAVLKRVADCFGVTVDELLAAEK